MCKKYFKNWFAQNLCLLYKFFSFKEEKLIRLKLELLENLALCYFEMRIKIMLSNANKCGNRITVGYCVADPSLTEISFRHAASYIYV